MSNQCFSLRDRHTRKSITPEEFGYCVFNWSKDSALTWLKVMDTGVYRESSLAKAFCKKPYGAHSQFMAINIAAYLFYASEFLRVPKDMQKRVMEGLNIELNAMKLSNGEPLHEQHIQYIGGSIREYIAANIEDLVSSRLDSPDIYKPDISAVAKKFFELMPRLYPDLKNILEIDRMLIGYFVAEIPFHLYKALNDESLVTYIE